jgi:pimeloyl-ACP methyl ester carboxylesterase
VKRFLAVGCGALLLTPFIPPVAQAVESQAKAVRWTPCADRDLKGVDCGSVAVPLDHAAPHGKMITVALSRAEHTGPARQYQGVLLVNPGGPGGGGRGFAAEVAADLPADVRRAYDVVGFDPRGVGASSPAVSCEPSYFAPVRPDYVVTTAAQEAVWLRRSRDYAQACGRKYGDLLDHLKSIDVVQDMDDIRQALGQQKINFFGASYGTYLGAVYATRYPGRVRRMVLDSSVRPTGIWYQSNLDQDYSFDASVKSLFGWIAAHDDVYGLGHTESMVERGYYALRARLAARPASGVLGPDELDDTLQIGAYLAPTWPPLAAALSRYILHGDPADLIRRYKAWGVTKEPEFAVYNAVQCTDAPWPKRWSVWKADAERIYAKAPYQAWGNTWFNAPCLFWPARPGTPVTIASSKDLPPILMFQATLDAATPFAGGLEMHRRLRGSRLVVEDGGRTHAIVQRGNACVDRKFDDFLATGALPAEETHCPKLPDPVPAGDSARPGSRARVPST